MSGNQQSNRFIVDLFIGHCSAIAFGQVSVGVHQESAHVVGAIGSVFQRCGDGEASRLVPFSTLCQNTLFQNTL